MTVIILSRFLTGPKEAAVPKGSKNRNAIIARMAKVESMVAVLQETKTSDTQVRDIVHEQLKPLMMSVDKLSAQHDALSSHVQDMKGDIREILAKLSGNP